MSTATQGAPGATRRGPSLRDRAAATVGDAKRKVAEEALLQGARVAGAESLADVVSMQVADAKELNERKFDHEHLSLDESERRQRKLNRSEESLRARAGQNVDLVGLAIALVIVGVVAYVGLAVMSTTEQSTSLDNDSEFQNASTDLTAGISDAYGLMGILFLVLILTGVVGLLLNLRGRR